MNIHSEFIHCYKEGPCPDLSGMTWDELKALAKAQYGCDLPEAHYDINVTKRAIEQSHTKYAKAVLDYRKECIAKAVEQSRKIPTIMDMLLAYEEGYEAGKATSSPATAAARETGE